MIKRPDTNAQRLKRHKRVRAKLSGTPERPRLNVFRSEKNIYAQVIDDVAGNTLVSASSLDKEIEGNGGSRATAATRLLPAPWASWWPSAARPRASTRSCSTVAVTCTTAVWPSWLKAPARAAWNSKEGGLINGKI